MKATKIEKINQLLSRTDMTGNQKVEWLTNFIDEYVTEKLRLHNVVGQSEQLPILDRCGCEEPNEEPIKVCMNCNGYVE